MTPPAIINGIITWLQLHSAFVQPFGAVKVLFPLLQKQPVVAKDPPEHPPAPPRGLGDGQCALIEVLSLREVPASLLAQEKESKLVLFGQDFGGKA